MGGAVPIGTSSSSEFRPMSQDTADFRNIWKNKDNIESERQPL